MRNIGRYLEAMELNSVRALKLNLALRCRLLDYNENSSFLGQMTRKVDFIDTLQNKLPKKHTVMIIKLSLFKDRH